MKNSFGSKQFFRKKKVEREDLKTKPTTQAMIYFWRAKKIKIPAKLDDKTEQKIKYESSVGVWFDKRRNQQSESGCLKIENWTGMFKWFLF